MSNYNQTNYETMSPQELANMNGEIKKSMPVEEKRSMPIDQRSETPEDYQDLFARLKKDTESKKN